MLNGIHFLLTYTCNYECDHCFLYCSPKSYGTFTLARIRDVLREADKIGTVEWIYFEGGEPLIYYPLLLSAVRLASEKGFKTAIVSNGYMTLSEEDAELWVKPLFDAGLASISISNDAFHSDSDKNPASLTLSALKKLGIPSDAICIEKPVVKTELKSDGKGDPIIGGGALFKGRAADTLTDGLPRRPFSELTECRYEELITPKRVHVDAFGHVHICQGISMGNMWEIPLSELIKSYNHNNHPICGPLVNGGPALLAETYGVNHETSYVDACHFCYMTRLALLGRFPEYLAPKQVYGKNK